MQRQRKFHRRSRNGCKSCKQRHVRCDGGKPVCANCVRTGGTCVFGDPFITVSGYSSDGPSQQQVEASESSAGSSSLAGSVTSASEDDTITSPPVQLTPDSRWLLESMRFRLGRWLTGLPGITGRVPRDSFVVNTALSQPGRLHGAMILEAVRKVWDGESLEDVRVPLLHHKMEACRFVGQRIQNPDTATDVDTVFVVAVLTLLEAAFWECSIDEAGYPVETHMSGLQRMLATLPIPQGGLQLTLFQRVIRMVMQGVQTGPGVRELYYSMGNTHMALVTMASYPNTDLGWSQGDCTRLATEEYAHQLGFTRIPDNMPLFIRRSRSTFMLTFIHLIATVRHYMVTTYMLSWLVEHFLHDLDRSEADMVRGTWDRIVWFWTAMYGAAAAASAVPRSREEEVEVEAWRAAFAAKIRLGSSILGLRDWQSTVALLQRINWEESFDGDTEMRRIWEEAVAED